MYKLGVVIWLDAHNFGDDHTIASYITENHKGLLSYTSGFIIKDDEVGVTLVTDMYGDTDMEHRGKGFNFIPRGMIKEVKYYG